MESKQYVFTEFEIIVLREAMIEYCQHIKKANPKSHIAIKQKSTAEVLKEQFKNDIR